ncbi:MAG: Uma2 family endonuclease [Bacteroidota bacterium]
MCALPAYASPATYPPPVSEAAYLAFDAASEARCEFWDGEIVAMAGESFNHAVVKDDLVAAMRSRFPGCTVLSASLRVQAPGYKKSNYAYPDALVTCEPEQFDDTHQPPTLLNPTLLVEVTSDSTRSVDMDAKLQAYFLIESLREYWVVDPDRPHVLRYVRPDPQASGLAVIHLANDPDGVLTSALLTEPIPLADIYARTVAAERTVSVEHEEPEDDAFREDR